MNAPVRMSEGRQWGSYTLDADWRMLNVSPEVVAQLGGINPEGQVIWDVFPQGVGGEFWHAAHKARREGVPVRNVSRNPVYGMLWESVTVPDGDLLRVKLRRIDLLDRMRSLEETFSDLRAAVGRRLLLPVPPDGASAPLELPSGLAGLRHHRVA